MINQTYRKNKRVLPKIFYFSPLFLQTLIWPITRFILRFFGHFKVEGLENLKNLKAGEGVIFVSNHSSELDPILLPASLPFLSRFMPFFYTSREKSFYKNSGWRQLFYGGLFFKFWGAHPIRPGLKDYEKSLETHIRLVEEGKSVLIFPEGKKTLDGSVHPEKARGGLGFMAQKTDKFVVPVYIEGVFNLSSKLFFSRKREIKVVFLKPLKFSDFPNTEGFEEKEEIDNIYKNFSRRVLIKIITKS